IIAMALAESASVNAPPPHPRLRERVLLALRSVDARAQDAPAGFAFHWAGDDRWLPHPVPGIRMKILSLNKARGYATLLLDVAPGSRFAAHHHGGAEECYVVSGSLFTCGKQLHAGDFVHADAETDHGELWTEEGCRVILIVPPEEHLPAHLLR